MTLGRLKRITIVVPVLFLTGVEIVRRTIRPDLLQSWVGDVLVGGIVLFATLLLAENVFGRIEQMQARTARQNRELLALHEAGLDVAGELELGLVLQKIVDRAAGLLDARYGALSLPKPSGGIESFITFGISPEERVRIGPPPVGHGLLAVVLEEGQRIRTSDLAQDPRSVGFPEHHPPMHSLLAVPIVSGNRVLGNLYLAEKVGAKEFDPEDERTLVRFATQAALAIENARLHQRVREFAITEERERIAREMHDSLAQVLGYVNTKSQAIEELLSRGESERASAQVAQLGTAARSAYADVREGILALRTTLGGGRTLHEALEEYLEQWKEQSQLDAKLTVEPGGATLDRLPPASELQLLRIVQEALSNVRKHAKARGVEVRISARSDRLETLVVDDGLGFAPHNVRSGNDLQPHFGLATMRERAESVGGTLAVMSTPGAGTTVSVSLPARVG